MKKKIFVLMCAIFLSTSLSYVLLFKNDLQHRLENETLPSTKWVNPDRKRSLANSPWPCFRGDRYHTGQSQFDTSNNNGMMKWNYSTKNSFYSSLALGPNGTIYFGCDEIILYAIDRDGKEKWTISVEGDDGAGSTPLVDSKGLIYINSHDFFYAVFPNGSIKWSFSQLYGGGSSPIIDSNGIIYFGSMNGTVYALYPNGSKKWGFETDGRVYSSPVISNNGSVIFASYDKYIYSIKENGGMNWKFRMKEPNRGSSPAIGEDGTIYVGCGHFSSGLSYLYAINPDGTEKWKFQTERGIISSPAISSNGTIYFGSYDNHLYAVNSDGTLKWKYETNDWVLSSPAISAEGIIYFTSYDNNCYSLFPNGTLKWKFDLKSSSDTSPIIDSDGTIYVGSRNHKIYAIGEDILFPIMNIPNIPLGIIDRLFTINFSAEDSDTISDDLMWTMITNASWLNFSQTQELFGTPTVSDIGTYLCFGRTGDGLDKFHHNSD